MIRALALGALLLACGIESTEVYEVTGRVEAVDASAAQVKIAHQDIPGFMPAMTMSFDVASPELLVGIAPGARVRFLLERSATNLRILELSVTAEPEAGFQGAPPAPTPQIAPDFELVGHDGQAFSLSDLRGRAVFMDFIFTTCPGPCPILTAGHVRLQRRIPPELAERTHFVSVSLDPETDTPERLRNYADKHRADLARWTFATGEAERIQAVLDDYGVGRVRTPDGQIDHLLVSFLISPAGEIVGRYPGVQTNESALLADLRRVLA